jgi:hypothetical protein
VASCDHGFSPQKFAKARPAIAAAEIFLFEQDPTKLSAGQLKWLAAREKSLSRCSGGEGALLPPIVALWAYTIQVITAIGD